MFVLSFTTCYVVVMNTVLIWFHLILSAIVEELVIIYLFSFDLYTTFFKPNVDH